MYGVERIRWADVSDESKFLYGIAVRIWTLLLKLKVVELSQQSLLQRRPRPSRSQLSKQSIRIQDAQLCRHSIADSSSRSTFMKLLLTALAVSLLIMRAVVVGQNGDHHEVRMPSTPA